MIIARKLFSEKEKESEVSKVDKKFKKLDTAINATTGAGFGAAMGSAAGGKKGAAIGAAVGGGIGALSTSHKKLSKSEADKNTSKTAVVGSSLLLGTAGKVASDFIVEKNINKDVKKRLTEIGEKAMKGDKAALEFLDKASADPVKFRKLISEATNNSKRRKTANKIGIATGLVTAAGLATHDQYKRKKYREAYKKDKE